MRTTLGLDKHIHLDQIRFSLRFGEVFELRLCKDACLVGFSLRLREDFKLDLGRDMHRLI